MSREDLRPVERVVLRLGDAGLTDSEIAARLRRSPSFVTRVATYAGYKLERDARGAR